MVKTKRNIITDISSQNVEKKGASGRLIISRGLMGKEKKKCISNPYLPEKV